MTRRSTVRGPVVDIEWLYAAAARLGWTELHIAGGEEARFEARLEGTRCKILAHTSGKRDLAAVRVSLQLALDDEPKRLALTKALAREIRKEQEHNG